MAIVQGVFFVNMQLLSAKTQLYLRNLPTHTIKSLLQKLNYVKQFQYSSIKHKFNIIHILCENSRAIPCVLCKLQLI